MAGGRICILPPAIFKSVFDVYNFSIISNLFDSNKSYALCTHNRKCANKMHHIRRSTPNYGDKNLNKICLKIIQKSHYSISVFKFFFPEIMPRIPLEQWFSTLFLSWPIFCYTKVLWLINFLSFLNEFSSPGADPENFGGGMKFELG